MSETATPATATAATATKGKTPPEQVKMTDGRVVEFSPKKKMNKSLVIGEDGSVTLNIDFRNGEARSYAMNRDLLIKFAAHGMSQKYGDEPAGLKAEDGGEADLDDIVLAIDELHARLATGEWNERAEGAGVSGMSTLLKALIEVYPGKTSDELREFLRKKSQAEKLAMRELDKLKPVIQRIEAERAAKRRKEAPPAAELLAGLEG